MTGGAGRRIAEWSAEGLPVALVPALQLLKYGEIDEIDCLDRDLGEDVKVVAQVEAVHEPPAYNGPREILAVLNAYKGLRRRIL